MRDKLAYKLMTFILNRVATKKYQSFINVATGLGMFTLENDLMQLDEDQMSAQARFGEYVFYNWKEFEENYE